MVPFWKEALEMVLDVEPEEDSSKIPDVSIVENSAELLYGLVHQRFILTKAGLSSMVGLYEHCMRAGTPSFADSDPGGEIRARSLRCLSEGVLPQHTRAAMRSCRYTRRRHCQVAVPKLWRYLYPTQQQISRNRW